METALHMYLGESYIYGTGEANDKSYKINIQSGHTSVVLPDDLDLCHGVVYFDIEGGNRIILKSSFEKGEDIQIYVNDDKCMTELAKDLFFIS
jgi:hypothetical protein